MITREQARMKDTWGVLTDKHSFPMTTEFKLWNESEKNYARKYLGALRKTPARIHSSGLGQAMAFLRSRGDEVSKDLCNDLGKLVHVPFGIQGDDLIATIRSQNAAFQFAATDEAMQICGWLIRYMAGAGVTAEEER